MKQSAAKTLGVAALGAAFAAVGAGAAEAAPALPDTGPALGNVAESLPVNGVVETLPAGGAVSRGQEVLSNGLTTARPVLESVAKKGPTGPVAGLLGGLPLEGLPTHGLPVNGIPLG
ncbi:ATP-binding protein [Streptomyces minutiscleroticus]|uniref:ATP-binding protein n=1 Tax=Streptomyces minutiscleroticus TaxID=68238 RepID=A0A918NCQ4_9ACTN|nr:ATP-binding protein [Streptomyces minutiscleroticus]GGX58040.1 hypothetical protein GCM10010358_10410 [Streptomyces minutiscleroticus]